MKVSIIGKQLLLDMVRQALKTACFGDKMRVVLETLLDTPIFTAGKEVRIDHRECLD